MKQAIKISKLLPFLLSAFWVIFFLWIELAPKTAGTRLEFIYNFIERRDYMVYDLIQISTLHNTNPTEYPIVIITIDDKSIQQEGPWPWPYVKIANLIAKLREQGVTVIASDLVFSEAEKNIVSIVKNKLIQTKVNTVLLRDLNKLEPEFDNNDKLIQQVKNKNDIVFPFFLYDTDYRQGQLPKPEAVLNIDEINTLTIPNMPGFITNFDALQTVSSHNGFISRITDEDGVIRRTPMVLRYQDRVYPSLSLAVAQLLLSKNEIKLNTLEIDGIKYLESIQLGDRHIPTDKSGQVLIPFHGKAQTFKYYSATDILKNKLKQDELKHVVVFIGATAQGFASSMNTSVDKRMPEVEVDANVLRGILDNTFHYVPYWGKAATIGLILFIGIALTFLLPLISPVILILLSAFVFTSLMAIHKWLWVAKGIVFSFSAPFLMTVMLVLTNLAYGFLFENRKKKFLRDVFSQYLAPDYVKILIDQPDEYRLDGESMELTVLFADIRHFTTISEHLNAAGVKKLLNDYFTPMTKIIFNHAGTIDKYVGDMIMAFWGAPITNAHQREAAIEAALDMLAKCEELKAVFRAAGLPDVDIGIGINTGIMNVGDMGSEFRRCYTVVGDPVNLASRLESATKFYGVKLLVGSATRAGLTQFVFRWLDRVKVKGKHKAVDVYEVICRTREASSALLQEVDAHERAISAYLLADWKLAHKLFLSLGEQHPDTLIYKIFLERIVYFKNNPPADNWDGSYEREEK